MWHFLKVQRDQVKPNSLLAFLINIFPLARNNLAPFAEIHRIRKGPSRTKLPKASYVSTLLKIRNLAPPQKQKKTLQKPPAVCFSCKNVRQKKSFTCRDASKFNLIDARGATCLTKLQTPLKNLKLWHSVWLPRFFHPPVFFFDSRRKVFLCTVKNKFYIKSM